MAVLAMPHGALAAPQIVSVAQSGMLAALHGMLAAPCNMSAACGVLALPGMLEVPLWG